MTHGQPNIKNPATVPVINGISELPLLPNRASSY